MVVFPLLGILTFASGEQSAQQRVPSIFLSMDVTVSLSGAGRHGRRGRGMLPFSFFLGPGFLAGSTSFHVAAMDHFLHFYTPGVISCLCSVPKFYPGVIGGLVLDIYPVGYVSIHDLVITQRSTENFLTRDVCLLGRHFFSLTVTCGP